MTDPQAKVGWESADRYLFVTHSLRAMLQADTERELLQRMCDLALQTGPFELAWVGYRTYAQAPEVEMELLAAAGLPHTYLQFLQLPRGRVALAEDATRQAIQTARVQFWSLGNDRPAQDDSRTPNWQQAFETAGLHSMLVLPIVVESQAIGVLVLYSRLMKSVTATVRNELQSLAASLATALQKISKQKEQQLIERNLLSSQARYQGMFNHASVSLMEIDASQLWSRWAKIQALANDYRPKPQSPAASYPQSQLARQIRVVSVNEASLHLLQAASLLEINTQLRLIMAPCTRDFFRELILSAIQSDGKATAETKLQTVQAESRVVILSLKLPVRQSAWQRLVVSIQDVTHFRQLQQRLAQSEKLLALGTLSAGLAHELNNPLAGVSQGIQNLRFRLTEANAKNQAIAAACDLAWDRLQHYLQERGIERIIDRITQSSQRATAIVTNMSRFGQAGSAPLTDLQLHKVVDAAVQSVYHDMHYKHQTELQLVLLKSDWPRRDYIVPGITIELQQAFINIIQNAFQALFQYQSTDPEWKPTIEISAAAGKHSIILKIADNGPGIPRSMIDRVFDPFISSKQPGQGMGLGLSICYYIIHSLHNGQLSVESQPNQGTTFIVELPCRNPDL
ncbi:MAG: GAF domain-containing protein [Leptospiraceae bacterium]|nr:GAF domain-containing protein [Leptospiraceae bacterium]